MKPLAPLETSFALRASANSSGDLFYLTDEEVAGLLNKAVVNSLYEIDPDPSASYSEKRASKSYLNKRFIII